LKVADFNISYILEKEIVTFVIMVTKGFWGP